MQNKSKVLLFILKIKKGIYIMNFGKALEELKNGNKIAREGWNGKGMYIFKHEGFDTNEASNITGDKHNYVPPFICMKTAAKMWLFGWLASQSDMLAEDWKIIR